MTLRIFIPRDAARWRSAPTRSRPRSRRAGRTRGIAHRDRAHRLARPLLARADGRGRDAAGRIAYGPVAAATLPALLDADSCDGKPHPLRLGPPDDIPWLKRQTRLTFARCGIIDPLSLDDYRAHGG